MNRKILLRSFAGVRRRWTAKTRVHFLEFSYRMTAATAAATIRPTTMAAIRFFICFRRCQSAWRGNRIFPRNFNGIFLRSFPNGRQAYPGLGFNAAREMSWSKSCRHRSRYNRAGVNGKGWAKGLITGESVQRPGGNPPHPDSQMEPPSPSLSLRSFAPAKPRLR